MKKVFLSLVTFIFSHTVWSQPFYEMLKNPLPGENFIRTSERINRYFDSIPLSDRKKNGYNFWKRMEYYAMKRLDGNGNQVNSSRYNAAAIQSELSKREAIARSGEPPMNIINGFWDPVGPVSITSPNPNFKGRVNCLAFHPSDGNIIYAGTPGGGVWKTFDGGSNWVPLSDGLSSLAVSGIAINPVNPDIIYIATGDPFNFQKPGAGVFKSTDAGITWLPTGLQWQTSQRITSNTLIMAPANPNVLLAATSDGIYRTSNAGASWNRVTTNRCNSIKFKANDPAKLIAVALAPTNRVILSSDTGKTWTNAPLFSMPAPGSAAFSGGEISITPASPDDAYIILWRGAPDTAVVVKYNWPANTLTQQSTPGLQVGSFGWYCLGLWVSPVNPNFMCAAGVPSLRTTNGSNFFFDQDILHADVHGYFFNPVNNRLYNVNDGGIFYSINNGDTWTNITSNMMITEYYRLSGVKTDSKVILAGSQDNGHHYKTDNSGIFDWKLTCCDGMDNAIEQTNPNIMYGFTQNGQINKSVNGGASFVWIPPTIMLPNEPWVTPFLIHTTTPATIFYGSGNGVLRHASRGEPTNAWTNIGGTGTSGMVMGTNNPNRFYGIASRTVFRSDNINAAMPSWTNISDLHVLLPSGLLLTSIDINPDNDQEIWVTVSGYDAGNKVFRSLTAGDDWTNLSAGLPNVNFNVIKFQDTNGSPSGAVYVGTDIGVYYRNDIIGQWIFFSDGLPYVSIEDIEINETFSVITAATSGRGIWKSSLYTPGCLNDINITSTLTGVHYKQAANSISMNNDVYGGTNTRVLLKAGNVITLTPGVDVLAGNELKAFLAPCANDNPVFRQQNNGGNSLPKKVKEPRLYQIELKKENKELQQGNEIKMKTSNLKK